MWKNGITINAAELVIRNGITIDAGLVITWVLRFWLVPVTT